MSGISDVSRRGNRPTRVLIVDDHRIFADLLARALGAENDFDCVGTAQTSAIALDLAARCQPDLVVMDIQLAGQSGIDTTRRVRALLPGTVVVAVSAQLDPNWLSRAAQSGASGFASKSGSLAEMLAVLRGARNGSVLIAPSFFNRTTTVTPPPAALVGKLTAREQDVLVLMGKGMAPSAIARLLNITVSTCRGYVKSIHAKLGASSQLEAVVKAQRVGLIAVA